MTMGGLCNKWVCFCLGWSVALCLTILRVEEESKATNKNNQKQKHAQPARSSFFNDSYLVDPASSDMLVSKIKPCTC